MAYIRNLWHNEEGQDLIEYTIILSFISIATIGLFIGAGKDVKQVWTVSNNDLAQANAKAS